MNRVLCFNPMKNQHDARRMAKSENWRRVYKKRGAYWTPLHALTPLIAHEIGDSKHGFPNPIWEPACGEGNIAEPLRELGHRVHCTDIQDYGCPGYAHHDFLATWKKRGEVKPFKAIVTNPPYSNVWKWVEHAVKFVQPKPEKVAMLLPASSLGDCVKVLPGSGMSLTRILMFKDSPIFNGPDGTADVNWGCAWFVFTKGEDLKGEVVMV